MLHPRRYHRRRDDAETRGVRLQGRIHRTLAATVEVILFARQRIFG